MYWLQRCANNHKKISPGKKKTNTSIHLLACHYKPHILLSHCAETSTQLWLPHQSQRNVCRRDQPLKSKKSTAVISLFLHLFNSINITDALEESLIRRRETRINYMKSCTFLQNKRLKQHADKQVNVSWHIKEGSNPKNDWFSCFHLWFLPSFSLASTSFLSVVTVKPHIPEQRDKN